MITQWAETQIDSSHLPEHYDGPSHGHTWFIRVGRIVSEAEAFPSVLEWHEKIAGIAAKYDHRPLKKGEGLAEQLAMLIGAESGADFVEVWRFIRGGKIAAQWSK
jgi:hypothetical protein